MDVSERMHWVKEAEEAVLNMVIVFPKKMRHDETFLDLDASIKELKATDLSQHDSIVVAVKELQSSLSNFLRVHPEIKTDVKYQPLFDDLAEALSKLFSD